MLPVKPGEHFVSGAIVSAKTKCITFVAMKGLNQWQECFLNEQLFVRILLKCVVSIWFLHWASTLSNRKYDIYDPMLGRLPQYPKRKRRAGSVRGRMSRPFTVTNMACRDNKTEKDSLVQLSQQHKPQNNFSWQTYHNRNDRTDKEKVGAEHVAAFSTEGTFDQTSISEISTVESLLQSLQVRGRIFWTNPLDCLFVVFYCCLFCLWSF